MARRPALKTGNAGPAEEQDDTRLRLLDIAETLFAREGIDNVSLRAVMASAGTNVAAIHYHFGSKQDLLREIFIRRMKPLLEDRSHQLEALLAGKVPPTVGDIVDAYVRPTFEFDCAQNNFGFNRLLARLSLEPADNDIDFLRMIQGEVDGRFLHALGTLLPKLTREQLALRLTLLHGMLTQATSVRTRQFPMNSDGISAELVLCGTAMFLAQD